MTEKLREEVWQVRSQLETEKTRWDELREELDDREETCGELRSELSDLKQKSAAARDLPDVYDVLNRVKAEDSKSKLTPGDIKRIYRILEES